MLGYEAPEKGIGDVDIGLRIRGWGFGLRGGGFEEAEVYNRRYADQEGHAGRVQVHEC